MSLQALWEPSQQFQNTNGSILTNGKIYVYYRGRSGHDDLAELFTDETGEHAHQNPVILDDNGRGVVFASPSFSYTAIVTDFYGKELFSFDPVPLVGGEGARNVIIQSDTLNVSSVVNTETNTETWQIDLKDSDIEHWLSKSGVATTVAGDGEAHKLLLPTNLNVDYEGEFIRDISNDEITVRTGVYLVQGYIKFRQDDSALSNELQQVKIDTGDGTTETHQFVRNETGPDAGEDQCLEFSFIRHVSDPSQNKIHIAPMTDTLWSSANIERLNIVRLNSTIRGGGGGTGDYTAGQYISIDNNYVISVTGLQPEGDYAYASAVSGFATKEYVDSAVSGLENYSAGQYIQITEDHIINVTGLQPAGDYVTQDEMSAYQPSGDYVTHDEMSAYQPSGDYQPAGDYAYNSAVSAKLDSSAYVEPVQSDWNDDDDQSLAYIKNKPTIPSLDGYATENYVDSAVSGKLDSSAYHEYSGGDHIKIDNYEISVSGTKDVVGTDGISIVDNGQTIEIGISGDVGKTYSAGQYVSIENEIISVTGLQEAGDYAYTSALNEYQTIQNMSAYVDNSTFEQTINNINSGLSGKLDSSAYIAPVQSDWNQNDDTALDFIKNKPDIPSLEGYATEDYVNSAVSGKLDSSAYHEPIEYSAGQNIAIQNHVISVTGIDVPEYTEGDYISIDNNVISVTGIEDQIQDILAGLSGSPSYAIADSENMTFATSGNDTIATLELDDISSRGIQYNNDSTGFLLDDAGVYQFNFNMWVDVSTLSNELLTGQVYVTGAGSIANTWKFKVDKTQGTIASVVGSGVIAATEDNQNFQIRVKFDGTGESYPSCKFQRVSIVKISTSVSQGGGGSQVYTAGDGIGITNNRIYVRYGWGLIIDQNDRLAVDPSILSAASGGKTYYEGDYISINENDQIAVTGFTNLSAGPGISLTESGDGFIIGCSATGGETYSAGNYVQITSGNVINVTGLVPESSYVEPVQSDWIQDIPSELDYIKNKPEEVPLSAGPGIDIVDMTTYMLISANGGVAPADLSAYQPVSAMSGYQPAGDYLTQSDLDGYATESYVDQHVEAATSGKADVSAIPSLQGYATQTYVQQNVSGKLDASAYQPGETYTAGENISIEDQIISVTGVNDLSAGEGIWIAQSGDGYVIGTSGTPDLPEDLLGIDSANHVQKVNEDTRENIGVTLSSAGINGAQWYLSSGSIAGSGWWINSAQGYSDGQWEISSAGAYGRLWSIGGTSEGGKPLVFSAQMGSGYFDQNGLHYSGSNQTKWDFDVSSSQYASQGPILIAKRGNAGFEIDPAGARGYDSNGNVVWSTSASSAAQLINYGNNPNPPIFLGAAAGAGTNAPFFSAGYMGAQFWLGSQSSPTLTMDATMGVTHKVPASATVASAVTASAYFGINGAGPAFYWLGNYKTLRDSVQYSEFEYEPETSAISAINGSAFYAPLPEGYATESWVEEQGYLTEVPAGYATEEYVTQQTSAFVTQEDIEAATSGKVDTSAISDMATQTWVGEQGYLTEIPSTYATDDDVIAATSGKLDSSAYVAPVQSDWNESASSALSFIQNKPEIENFDVSGISAASGITITEAADGILIGTSGLQPAGSYASQDYVDSQTSGKLDTSAYVQADWTESASSAMSYIQNKPEIGSLVAGPNMVITKSGSSVTIGTSGLVEEAPIDGNYYARRNGAWVDITSYLNIQ